MTASLCLFAKIFCKGRNAWCNERLIIKEEWLLAKWQIRCQFDENCFRYALGVQPISFLKLRLKEETS